MELSNTIHKREKREVYENPFLVMEVGESFAVPSHQYATWQARSQYWAVPIRRKRRGLSPAKFSWQTELDEQGQSTGMVRCWRIR